jgi:Fe(3+) dicitrate transport protein
MVPPVTLKIGNTLKYKNFSTTLQYAYTAEHFSDASDTRRTASAIEGIIVSNFIVFYSITKFIVFYSITKFVYDL